MVVKSIRSLHPDYMECILDIDIFGKIVGTPQQSLEEMKQTLFEEFKLRTPMPTLESKRYELSRLVNRDCAIEYNGEVELQDGESLVELAGGVSRLPPISFDLSQLVPEDTQAVFRYEDRVTDSYRQSIIDKYDLETGEEFKPGVHQTEKIVGSTSEDKSLYLSDDEIDSLGEPEEPAEDEEAGGGSWMPQVSGQPFEVEFDEGIEVDGVESADDSPDEEDDDSGVYDFSDDSNEESADEEPEDDSGGSDDYSDDSDEDSDDSEDSDDDGMFDDLDSYDDSEGDEDGEESDDSGDYDAPEEPDGDEGSDDSEDSDDSDDDGSFDDLDSYEDGSDEESEDFGDDYAEESEDSEDSDDDGTFDDLGDSDEEDDDGSFDDLDSYEDGSEEEPEESAEDSDDEGSFDDIGDSEDDDSFDDLGDSDDDDGSFDDIGSEDEDDGSFDELDSEDEDDGSFDELGNEEESDDSECYEDDISVDETDGSDDESDDYEDSFDDIGVSDDDEEPEEGSESDDDDFYSFEEPAPPPQVAAKPKAPEVYEPPTGVDDFVDPEFVQPPVPPKPKPSPRPTSQFPNVAQPAQSVAQAVDRSSEPTDIRQFLRKHPRCEISFALQYFTKKQIDDAVRIGKINRKGNILRC